MDNDTKPLFYETPYECETKTTILGLNTDPRFGPYIELSQTLCYPQGGGQKGDRALLLLDALPLPGALAELAIIDTRVENGGPIKHLLGSGFDLMAARDALLGATGTIRIDWSFRHMQMRLHGAAHLLHLFVQRALMRELAPPGISDLLPDHGLNVYEQDIAVAPETMAQALESLNRFIAEDHPMETFPDEGGRGRRWWKCAGELIPCGGVHLRSTREIGRVDVAASVRKGKTKMVFRVLDI